MRPPPRLVLLDRDGTLIDAPAEGRRYIVSPDEVRLAPDAAAAVGQVNRRGIPVVVVTNQRGVARGVVTAEALERIHERISQLLAEGGAWVDAWFVCPHDEGECGCRKPLPGLVAAALAQFGVQGEGACIVGDSESDMLAGAALGLRCIRLGAAGDSADADRSVAHGTAGSLHEAVEVALST